MAVDLAEELRKRMAADALAGSPDLSDAINAPADTTDASSDQPDATPTPAPAPIDIGKKKGQEYELIPEAAAAPKPAPAAPTPAPATPLVVPTPTPESPTQPADIQTDPETGTRYVQDQDQKVPHAELATPADKEAFKPGDVTLPQTTVQGTAAPGQPAPDKLDQVERGELVGLPWHPAKQVQPAPDQLAQVEKAQPVTAADQVASAPQKIPEISAPPSTPSLPATVFGMPVRGAAPAPPVPGPAPTPSPKPDLTPQADPTGVANFLSKAGSAPIVDSNDARLTTVSVGDQKWKVHQYAAPYFQGFLSELADQGAPITSAGGWNNRVIAGTNTLSQHAYGGAIDVSQEGRDVVSLAFQKWIQQNPGALQAAEQKWHIYGGERFGDLGHFEWGGVGGPASAPGDASTAGRDQGYVTGKATTFGYKDKGDPGVGAPRLGTISTNDPDLVGIAVPEQALRQQIGANPAAWRQARVDVMTQDGRHMLVPIVDLGPGDTSPQRGVAADFTQKLHGLLGNTGEQTYGFKIIPNAGPDVEKDPQAFIAEQRQLMTGADTRPKPAATPGTGPASRGGRQFELVPESAVGATPPSPAETTQATADTQKLQDSLQQSGNLIQFYKQLDTDPPKGMNPQVVASFKKSLQNTITQEMQRRFPDMTPDVAWKKSQEDSSVMDIGAEGWHQLTGSFAQLAPVFAQQSPDKEQVNAFFDNVMPGASDADKQAFLAKVHALPREQQGPFIASQLPAPQAGQRGNDPMAVLTAIDHLADPGFQAAEAKKLADARAFAEQAGTTDPRLKGSAGEAIASLGGVPEQLMAYYGIPIIGAAQAAEQTRARMAKEHPDWDEATLDDKSAMSALAQVAGNTVAAGLMTHGAGALLKAVASPWRRALAQVGIGALSNMGINVGTTAATNVAEGRPAGEDLGQAALAGAIQGGVVGGLHGIGELRAPVPEAAPEAAPEVRPPPLPVKTPVTGADITGPDVRDTTTYPWYKPDPIVSRGTERTSFTPSELAEATRTLPSGTPEQVQEAAEQLQPPTDFNQRGVFLDSAEMQQAEIAKAQATQAQQTEIENSNVAGALHKEGSLGTNGASTAAAGESEPWVSKIANRFTSERMASGDLGPVEPGTGVTKEQMIARGMKMGPEQINQHVSDVMSNRGGDPVAQASAIRAEEARLSQRSQQASLASEADPKNVQLKTAANDAFNDLTDFHNGPVAKLKNDWHAQGMTLQGEIPVDLSTFNGLRDAYLRDVGKPPPASAEPMLRKVAKQVRDSSAAETAALNNLSAEIERQSARRLLPTADQVRENIMKRMKVEPCPV
jgi:hypothetical protein